MKEKEKNIVNQIAVEPQSENRIDDRNEITQLLIFKTEQDGQKASLTKQNFENEPRHTHGGETFTISGLKEEYRKYIAEVEKNYEPKFSLFFQRLGKLCGWSDEEKKRFSKPRIAPLTINELFYNRFPEGTLQYIHEHNRYVGYCIRRTKNYKLLNEDGIRKLEILIDDANSLMPQCVNYYEFRKKMFDNFQVPYQIELFAEIF